VATQTCRYYTEKLHNIRCCLITGNQHHEEKKADLAAEIQHFDATHHDISIGTTQFADSQVHVADSSWWPPAAYNFHCLRVIPAPKKQGRTSGGRIVTLSSEITMKAVQRIMNQ
jgi:hypothetical protein